MYRCSCCKCVTEIIEGTLKDYSRLHDLPEPKLPVKYPRDLGTIYKPQPDDNPYNAWYSEEFILCEQYVLVAIHYN